MTYESMKKISTIVTQNPIIFDADFGMSELTEIERVRQLNIGGLVLGPLISDEIASSLKNIAKRYEVIINGKIIKIMYPLKGIQWKDMDTIDSLVRYVRELIKTKLLILRLSAAKYSELMKMLQLVPSEIDIIELDFSTPFLISDEKRNFDRLLYEIVHDATSMSSKPVAVRLPFSIPRIQELLGQLAMLNIAFISVSSTYLCYKSSYINGKLAILKTLCKDSSLNDLVLSLTRPWVIKGVNVVLSIETLDEHFIMKALDMGIKLFELGLSTFMLDLPSLLARIKKLKPKEVIEVSEEPIRGSMTIIVSESCDTCNGNYLCVKTCPEKALKIGKRGIPESLKPCSGCNLCVTLCPKNAIELALELKID